MQSRAAKPEGAVPSVIVAQDGSGDYVELATAVENVQPGTRIMVRPGSYRQDVTVQRRIDIIGDGPVDQIFVDHITFSFWSEIGPSIVRGLTVTGNRRYTAIQVLNGAVIIEECHIHGVNKSASGNVYPDNGIQVTRGAADVTVRSCKISYCNRGVLVTSRTADERGSLLDLQYSRIVELRLRPVLIDDCDISSNRSCGVYLDGGKSVVLRECRISHNHQFAVVCSPDGEKWQEVRLERCKVSDNEFGPWPPDQSKLLKVVDTVGVTDSVVSSKTGPENAESVSAPALSREERRRRAADASRGSGRRFNLHGLLGLVIILFLLWGVYLKFSGPIWLITAIGLVYYGSFLISAGFNTEETPKDALFAYSVHMAAIVFMLSVWLDIPQAITRWNSGSIWVDGLYAVLISAIAIATLIVVSLVVPNLLFWDEGDSLSIYQHGLPGVILLIVLIGIASVMRWDIPWFYALLNILFYCILVGLLHMDNDWEPWNGELDFTLLRLLWGAHLALALWIAGMLVPSWNLGLVFLGGALLGLSLPFLVMRERGEASEGGTAVTPPKGQMKVEAGNIVASESGEMMMLGILLVVVSFGILSALVPRGSDVINVPDIALRSMVATVSGLIVFGLSVAFLPGLFPQKRGTLLNNFLSIATAAILAYIFAVYLATSSNAGIVLNQITAGFLGVVTTFLTLLFGSLGLYLFYKRITTMFKP